MPKPATDTLPRLIHGARAALDRGDLFIGMERDFPDTVRVHAALIDLPIGVFEGRVLLKLREPRMAVNANGDLVSIVSQFGGHYYNESGHIYTLNELAWVTDKRLPDE